VVPPGGLVSEYARAAMPARMALERERWADAAALPLAASIAPVPAMVTRFARGIGAARRGDVAAASAEAAELERLETALAERGESYWARVAGIKRRAVLGWAAFAAGDTARGLGECRAAADLEDVTEKHPVTPGELLPARELQADLLLAVGRYAEAGAAYRATLAREPGRARSVFGAARAAELAGERAAAREGYRAFLELMDGGDGERAELAVARRAVAARD
jgi:tetratricopeptide (TPR) repeat protein